MNRQKLLNVVLMQKTSSRKLRKRQLGRRTLEKSEKTIGGPLNKQKFCTILSDLGHIISILFRFHAKNMCSSLPQNFFISSKLFVSLNFRGPRVYCLWPPPQDVQVHINEGACID